MDTIYALSSAQGKAGVAVVRMSGALAFAACAKICGNLPKARQTSLRVLRGKDGSRIDQALVLVFDEGASFTGEPSVEFQVHGSTAVVAALLAALGSIEGLRPAEAGEFTRRALENGQLDMAQVEGLADLLEAETEAQRRQALRVFSGDLGARAGRWRKDLIRSAALLEATIDFADEEVPSDVSPEVNALVAGVLVDLKREIAGVGVAERIRSGFEVAIAGAPNVGKSTLFNALAGRDAAITSDVAGTTRDVIEVRMDLGGLPVTVLDTAGLRETDDAVEALGVERAKARAAQADVRVFLTGNGHSSPDGAQPGDVVVVAKDDAGLSGGVSGKTGAGLSGLIERITKELSQRASGAGLATRVRHRDAMERGVVCLEAAVVWIGRGEDGADIAAEELRTAVRALDSLLGRVDIENVLDEIFASFCLGK